MKATGIVRRIDDLGRIVLPKEIRRAMSIREGDPLEIFVDNGNAVLKKYIEEPKDKTADLVRAAKVYNDNHKTWMKAFQAHVMVDMYASKMTMEYIKFDKRVYQMTTCHHTDSFNFEIGLAVLISRATGDALPEIFDDYMNEQDERKD